MSLRSVSELVVIHSEQIQSQHTVIQQNLVDIYEGGLYDHVKASLRVELKDEPFRRACERIAPINVLQRTVDKLSKVYAQGINRSAANSKDDNLVDNYEVILDINNQMQLADTLFNLNKYMALEPYLGDDGVPKMRVLGAHQFTVWTNDRINPTIPTVFVKFLGNINKDDFSDPDNPNSRQVNVYALYDDKDYIVVDSDNDDVPGFESGSHDFGRIPFVYCSNSKLQLIPQADIDSYAMAVLIPKLLTDLNYATQFNSHGIKYGIDIDVKNLDGNPDSFWVINSLDGENRKPEIGTLQPTIEIEPVLKLITDTVAMWLETKSLKASNIGKADSSASGVAKVIDNADVTDVRKANVKKFTKFEKEFWDLLSVMHEVWLAEDNFNAPELSSLFTSNFMISVEYGDMTPIEDPAEQRAELQFKLDNGLITKERAIDQANEDLTPEELIQLKQEIAIEDAKKESSENDKDSGDQGRELDNKGE